MAKFTISLAIKRLGNIRLDDTFIPNRVREERFFVPMGRTLPVPVNCEVCNDKSYGKHYGGNFTATCAPLIKTNNLTI